MVDWVPVLEQFLTLMRTALPQLSPVTQINSISYVVILIQRLSLFEIMSAQGIIRECNHSHLLDK